jgi:alpha/beta superfamily hydrolase
MDRPARKIAPEKPPLTRRVRFLPGPAGHLEAVTTLAAEPDAMAAIAIVCHPHPLHEGTMNNKVVHTLNRSFNHAGIGAIRFNFRGVGKSEGQYGEGQGETEDTLAVMDWAADEFPGVPIWLAGFSFGAYTSLRAATQRDIAGLISVAPPVHLFDLTELSVPDQPWLVVQGDQDEIVSCPAVTKWTRGLSPRPTLIKMKDAGHFFHHRLTDLHDVVLDFLSQQP